MCGICGKFCDAGVELAEIRRMADAIAHRGPDDQGYHLSGPIGLGARRLSIIDLEGGHQPLANEDRSIWIVYNGEIYNYQALRRDLEQNGHVFATRSDTEVIVHLYEELGEKCVEKLQGMFSFAIWDEKRQALFLARDRLGQKPLFYTESEGVFLFASELKAILAARCHAAELDIESLHHYLSLRFVPAPNTMFSGIQKLPPGHYLFYQNGTIRVFRYWQLSFVEKLDLSAEECLEALRNRLATTVSSHLVSDVPVGALLSGGLDSSMIVALAARSSPDRLKTFSIGVAEQGFNELPYARVVAERCGTHQIEETVEPRLIATLPKVIRHLDEPSDPIAACMFHAAELASRHVKVALGGDGGDELFGGFDRYRGAGWADMYRRIPAFLRRNVLRRLLVLFPESFAYKGWTQKLRWLEYLTSARSTGARYAQATCFFRFGQHEKKELFGDSFWRGLRHLDSADVIVNHFDNAPAEDPIDRMLYADFMTRLPEHSLMLTDRMSMAHGLEMRSPFLDHELVEFLAAFPSSLKINKGRLKFILRRLARDYLPGEIVRRPKQGFIFPVAYWFENELYSFVKHLLSESAVVKAGIFKKVAMLELLENHKNRVIDNHVRIWLMLSFEIWYQLYVENIAADSLIEQLKARLRSEAGPGARSSF